MTRSASARTDRRIEPIEQLVSLRAIPGMVVIRPADANEMSEAYRCVLQLRHRPAALICSRQALPIVDRTKFAPAAGLTKGAYVLVDAPDGKPDVILIASGSEVALCVAARDRLAAEGVAARVVSMPSWELFEEQDAAYRDSVLPPSRNGARDRRGRLVAGLASLRRTAGVVLGMHTFGMSAPMKVVAEHFGFTVGCTCRRGPPRPIGQTQTG